MPGVQRSTGSIGPVRVPRMLAFHRDTSMDISTTNNAWYVCGVCGVCGVPGGTICTILNSCLPNLVAPTPPFLRSNTPQALNKGTRCQI